MRPMFRMHVAVQSPFSCHSGPHTDLFEGQDYLFVGVARIRIHVSSVGISEEERILRHRVELVTSLFSRDIGEIDPVDEYRARDRIKDAEEREQQRRFATIVVRQAYILLRHFLLEPYLPELPQIAIFSPGLIRSETFRNVGFPMSLVSSLTDDLERH